MAGTKIKKGDLVQVIAGKDKGATGKVQVINTSRGKVIVEGLNMVKKSMKKRSQQEQGGIIEVEAPLDISNVQLVSKGSPTRIKYDVSNAKNKKRVAKKTGEVL